MRYLCLLAHPDDETIGLGGTIRRLADNGDTVVVVTATDGGVGEVDEKVRAKVKKAGSVGALRRQEFKKACEILGVSETKILDFPDGEIDNQTVWGDLTLKFVEMIDQYQPDIVITFDHTGWYFHLDHVGVSIAATLAVQQAEHKADALLFILHMPSSAGTRWKYVFPEKLPITHQVNIRGQRKTKLKALKAHASQQTTGIKDQLKKNLAPKEFFQAAFTTKRGEDLLRNNPIFEKI